MRTVLFTAFTLLIAGFAAWALAQQVRGLDWAAVGTALASLSWWRLAAAAGLLLVCLAAYAVPERLATAQLGRSLTSSACVLTALAAQGLSLSTGKGPLVAGLVRIRLLGRRGFGAVESIIVTLLVSLHGNAGLAVLIAFTLAVTRPWAWALPIAGMLAAGVAVWLLLGRTRAQLTLRGHRLQAPAVADQLIGIAAGAVEKLSCTLIAWVLMPQDPGLPLPVFIATLLVALGAARASQVPGGLGVLEATVLGLWPGGIGGHRETIIAGLLAFRLAYYLVPLPLAGVALAWPGGRRTIPPCATAFC